MASLLTKQSQRLYWSSCFASNGLLPAQSRELAGNGLKAIYKMAPRRSMQRPSDLFLPTVQREAILHCFLSAMTSGALTGR